MTLTVSSLQSVVPNEFLSLGFHDAEPYVGNAVQYFDSEVKRVIDAGQVWSGEGQPQAAAVMQTNSLALEACKLQMRAGMAATDSLYRAITKAKQELESVLSEIDAKAGEDDGVSYTVEDDGTVEYGTYPTSDAVGSGSSTVVPDPVLSEHRELTYRVQRVLNYANTADLTAAGLLERIARSAPAFTENVSPQALAFNKAVLDLAHGNLKLAEKAQQLWEDASPANWGDEIKSEAEAWFDAAANPPLRAYNNLPTGHPLNVFVEPPLLALGGAWTLISGPINSRPENRVPELDDPSNLLATKPTVEDSGLQAIIDDLYSPLALTPAELARLRSATGSGVLGDESSDALRDARDRLGRWLDHSYDELADGVQPSTHTEVVPLGGSHFTPTEVPDPHTLEYYDPEDFAVSPEDRETARQLYNQLSTVVGGTRRQDR